jgi:hypothetical protein
MNGVGVGFSVERQFVTKLPVIAEEFHTTDTRIKVSDSKIGWAKSLKELIALLYQGQIPGWDTLSVRPAGSILKTFGGRASGPEPLEDLFTFVVSTFVNAAGRKLTSLECHDIICKIAEIVVVGGVRRCLEYSYLINTTNGWKQISEIIPNQDKIIFEDQEIDILNLFDNGKQHTMKIEMEDGTEHISTPEHRWFVFNHDTNQTQWVETKDLKYGNYSMLKPK